MLSTHAGGFYPPSTSNNARVTTGRLLHHGLILSPSSRIGTMTSASLMQLRRHTRSCLPGIFIPLRTHRPQNHHRGFDTSTTTCAHHSKRHFYTGRHHPDSHPFHATPRPSPLPRETRRRPNPYYAMASRSLHDHDHHHGHGPLGHHHHHHPHDNAYLTSKDKTDPGVRITRLGLYSNLAMAVAKGIGGYTFNSHAMVADAWHSVTDLASDVLTLATVSWSTKDPTRKFPSGYGKIESLGSLGVSGMLVVGGILMGWSSAVAFITNLGVDPSILGELAHVGHSHSHGHGHDHGGVPSMHAAWLAAGTVVIKEWLYQASRLFSADAHTHTHTECRINLIFKHVGGHMGKGRKTRTAR